MALILQKKLLLTISILTFSFLFQGNEVITYVTANQHWAYKIKIKDKVIIKQEHIPAVKGVKYFKSEKDAYKVGALVLKKMENNPGEFPDVSVKELDSLQIEY